MKERQRAFDKQKQEACSVRREEKKAIDLDMMVYLVIV